MSQYNNMDYAQTEYQQCNNVKYNDNYYNGGTGSYDNYDNYDNYYDQGNRPVNNNGPVIPQRSMGDRIPVSRPSTRRQPPPINSSQSMMGQVTPRPSPPIRPINSTNSMRQSPQIRPINNLNVPRQSPQIRPINNMTAPRQSPQIRPINSMNSIRNSPQVRPVNSNSQMRPLNLNSTPQIRPMNSMNYNGQSPSVHPVNSRPIPTRKSTEVMQQRPMTSRQMSNTMMGTASRPSPQINPTSGGNLQNIPPRPTPPSGPQVRSNTTYDSHSSNSPKLPLRSQSSLSNLQKQQQQQKRQMSHSNLVNSNTLDNEEAYDLPLPPRTRQHRHSSISSQGSNDNSMPSQRKHSFGSESNPNSARKSFESNSSSRKHSFSNDSNPQSRKHSMSHEQDMNQSYDNNQGNNNTNYYDQGYDYNYPQTNYQSQRPPAPTPQYSNSNIPNQQNGSYYNNNNNNGYNTLNNNNNNGYNTLNNQPPQSSVPQGQQNFSYNNRPVNFHPQAMHNTIGNQYRPPPVAKPKTDPYDGKLPMTSLGGQPMPYGQSLEMYRQNAKKSNDPHVQLEFAKYLIAMADAALDSDPDQKVAHRNQEILYNEGLKWIKKLANQGGGLGKTPYAEAQFFLAECYGNGSIGLQIDHEKAFSYYLQASKQSHPPSTYRAAVCYEHGAGTKKDYTRAVQFYRKAAALGDILSMYKLGTILLNGTLNQDKNPREGLTWLKRAAGQADQSCPHALHELGMIYEGKNPETNGLIIPDPNYSQELYLKAAQFGYSPSQYKLGLCYEYGLLNLPMDSRRSIAWYSKAAEQGDPEAELALSGWYLTGAENVLKQSDKEAFLWARKAANKGLAKAEYAVGYYYEYGIGVKKDMEEAKRSYLSAASQNNKRALIRLKEMKAGYAGHGLIQGWREQSRGTGAASEDCVIS